jgi:hypothetical protein
MARSQPAYVVSNKDLQDDRPRTGFPGVSLFAKTLNSLTGRNEYRCFPAPWAVEEHNGCFIVRDDSYQTLAYIFFEEESGQRSLTRAEARLIAYNIARLPELQESAESRS